MEQTASHGQGRQANAQARPRVYTRFQAPGRKTHTEGLVTILWRICDDII